MLYLVTILGFMGLAGIYFFNRIIQFKNMMDKAASGIDVQLKRRHDLIPNLVETVKGYQGHERGTLEAIVKLRTQLMCPVPMKDRGPLENDLSRSLKSIFALAEQYLDLKANTNFLNLQNNLVEIEDQIQMSRRYYNGSVREYNIGIQSFPASLIAGPLNFKRSEFFELEYATERKTPDVKFS